MTSTTMLTTLDLVTPTSDDPRPIQGAPGASGTSDFSTVVLSSDGSELVTQSAPNTPIQHREQANAEFGKKEGNSDDKKMVAASGNTSKPNLNNFYSDGFGQIREGLFSCFKPVFGYFGGKAPEIKKSEDDEWEIPFDAISELEWLGSGSQGAVFRGQYQSRTVAVKKVNQLKETEIKHLRHLRHKNIIEFLGVCSKSPCYCIVMEYCSKGQLCTVLKTKNTITRELFSQWVQEIADGMHYLHQNKVIHRDLKSPNILISEEDSIKICDFGTSHLQKKNDSTMMSFCGTVSWMAPEMIKKEPCNEKVDVYSFGVVLWEMLTRETPYANIQQMAIIFGVGTNILNLPMPEAPEGLVLLIQQCLSQKGRNRPSFAHIRQHWEIFKPELFEMTEEEWQKEWDSYREFAKAIQYPSTITKDYEGKSAFAMEEELRQKRHNQLNHINDIRHLYETKLQRTNKMMDKLQECFTEVKLKEQDLAEWERELTELQWQLQNSPRAAAMQNAPRPPPIRGNCYPNEAYEYMSSDDDGQGQVPARGSPYRNSNTSTSSGMQSSPFSRQSSCRSSAGQQTRRSEGANPPQKILRNDNLRHSSSYWETTRGSPARGSGMSQDSGMWSAGASSMAINGAGGGQQVTMAQTLYRNGDGRWSDGRIASRRRVSAPKQPVFFTRDSPSRVPHGVVNYSSPRSSSKLNRSSYPSRNAPHQLEDACCCNHGRAPRAKSIAVAMSSRGRSPTPYDNEPDQTDAYIEGSNLPESTSYDEALKSIGEADDVEMATTNTNPIYASPITSYSNPHFNPEEEENANEIDLTSSMDSRRSRADDADVESSEDEGNGNNNILDTSMESADLRYQIDTSQSTMMSSLERSLELGANRSDGLSDNERRVQAVKHSIKTHRRTSSNPQAIIHQRIEEYSSSATDDSDDAAAVRI